MSETLVERIHALARKCAEQDAMLKALIAEVNVESLEKPYTAYKADPASIELNKLQDGALVVTDSPATTNFRLPNVGEIVTSLTPLDDPALHLLNGAKLSLDGMYKEGLLKIIALQNTHPNLFVTESDWQTSIATYNVCGKFVYDSVANTVRLPLVTGFMEGTIDSSVLGDLVEAGLPNITGNITTFSGNYAGPFYKPGCNGAFSATDNKTNRYAYDSSTQPDAASLVNLDASRSSAVYGNSDTVQPQSTKVFYYIVLANTISTPVIADIQREVDSKVNAEEAAHAAMPDPSRVVHMSIPTQTIASWPTGYYQWTAPVDCHVSIQTAKSGTGSSVLLRVAYGEYTTADSESFRNNTVAADENLSNSSSAYLSVNFFVPKDQTITIVHNCPYATWGRYFPCIGAV